jgi:hypothetical protein
MIRDQGVAMLLRGAGETRAHFHTGTRGTTQQRDINVTAEGLQAPVKTPTQAGQIRALFRH